jgi:hypothetical protein
MEVLEDQTERLNLAFAEEQSLGGLDGALASFSRIESVKRTIRGENIKKR